MRGCTSQVKRQADGSCFIFLRVGIGTPRALFVDVRFSAGWKWVTSSGQFFFGASHRCDCQLVLQRNKRLLSPAHSRPGRKFVFIWAPSHFPRTRFGLESWAQSQWGSVDSISKLEITPEARAQAPGWLADGPHLPFIQTVLQFILEVTPPNQLASSHRSVGQSSKGSELQH